MYATERQQQIQRLLSQEGRVGVVDLAKRFDVTTETVRRDLDQLESAGALLRVHGGAVTRTAASTVEPTLVERRKQRSAAKAAIAARALGILGESYRGSVFVDAGTTTAALAAQLAPRLAPAGAEVVTHSLALAQMLSTTATVPLTIIGGRVRGVTSAAVGADTVRAIEALRPDVAFVGTNGISTGFGLSTPDPEEGAVKRAIVRSARRVVVVADSAKFERELLVGFAALDDIDVLVCESAPPEPLAEALAAAEVEVWLA